MKIRIYIFLFLLGLIVDAQTKVSGVVMDAGSGFESAYADVYFEGTDISVITNSDGSFYLESAQTQNTLVVEQFGFDKLTYALSPGANYDLVLEIQPSTDTENIALNKLVITANEGNLYKNKKENPAFRILRELWKRKRSNGLKKVDNFSFEEYEKIQFDFNNIDSTIMDNKLLKDFEFVFQNVDTSRITGSAYLPMFLNESIYKVYGRNHPNQKKRKDLVASKTSGFQNNDIVSNTAKNLYQEYDIYQNRLNFFNKAFVSPVARDGFSVYNYRLMDTAVIKDKPCYRIKYFPKRDNELTFKGEFCVDTLTYSLSDIIMESTKGINVNFIKDVYVEQEFDILNDSVYVPKKEYMLLDLSFLSKKKKSKGIFAHRTVSYKDYDFSAVKNEAFYNDEWDPYIEGAFEKDSVFWSNGRHEKLSKDQKNIYATLDTLQKIPRFQNIVTLVETLGSGYYNVGNAIDIGNLYSTVGFNEVEGWRLRAGARTFFSQNDMWRAAFYTAYGFKDRKMKYGAEFRYMFNKYNRFMLGIGTKRDIEQLGSQLTTSNGIMTRSFASSSILNTSENNLLSSVNKTNAFVSINPWDNVACRLDGTHQTIKTANPTEFNIDFIKENQVKSELINTSLSLSLLAHPGAKYSRYGIDRYEHTTLSPTFLLRYTHGFNGVMDGDFNYDKLQFYFYIPALIGSFGRADISFETGKTFQAVPLSLLSVVPGNQTYGYVPGTFSQLDFYEFITDTYASFIWDHHFNGRLLSRVPVVKKWNLRTVAFFRGAWGDISDRAKEINASNITYTAPNERIYYEYGVGIENIGLGNIRPLRVNFNWRGNYLDVPDARAFGVTLGMDFSF